MIKSNISFSTSNLTIVVHPKLPRIYSKDSLLFAKSIQIKDFKPSDQNESSEIASTSQHKIDLSSSVLLFTDPEDKQTIHIPQKPRRIKKVRQKSVKSYFLSPKRIMDPTDGVPEENINKQQGGINSFDKKVSVQMYGVEGRDVQAKNNNMGLFPVYLGKSYVPITPSDFIEENIEPVKVEASPKTKSLTTQQRIATRAALKYFSGFAEVEAVQAVKKNLPYSGAFPKKNLNTFEVNNALKGRILDLVREKTTIPSQTSINVPILPSLRQPRPRILLPIRSEGPSNLIARKKMFSGSPNHYKIR